MNREEARLELDATTLRPQDASPEARAMAENDPQLAAWLEKRTAFDETVADALQAMTVDDGGLRDRILRGAAPNARRSMRWITPTLAAAAACVAFGWVLFWPGNAAMAAWESESLHVVAQVEYGVMKLDAKAETYEAIRKQLNERDCPCPSTLPPSLSELRTYGCKRIQVDGRPATIICFALESGKEAHLIVLDNTGLSDCPAQDALCFKSSRNWHYASWSHGSQAFMLATTADPAELKQLFG
ncbi:MAG: hypothetical protein R3F13_18325 [Prosthecobacter sp.]